MLPVRSILSDLDSYNIEDLQNNNECLRVYLTQKRRKASCPRCGKTSRSVHSRYIRTLAHVPITLTRVELCLVVRRFRCGNPSCEQRIFAERANGLCRTYARTTEVNRKSLQRIGAVAGANPGQRLAGAIGIRTSATTLRRRILETPIPDQNPVRVLGVDDWAWRKGLRYGTILCDLESGRIVDLLPDRSAASLEQWLKDHPGPQIINRDRASCYSEGARKGAPNAVQVADRWHLLQNLREALEKLLFRYHKELKIACDSLCTPVTLAVPDAPLQSCRMHSVCSTALDQAGAPGGDNPLLQVALCARPHPGATEQSEPETTKETFEEQGISQKTKNQAAPDCPIRKPSQAQQNSLQRREARRQRYDQVLELQQQGRGLRAIARETGLSRATVRRYVASEAFPEMSSRERRGVQLDPYEPFIRQQLALGNKTRKQLLEDLKRFGYTGSISALSRYIWNRLKIHRKPVAPTANATKLRYPAPRSVAMTMIRPDDKRTEEENAFLVRLAHNCPQIATASNLAKGFSEMVRQRLGETFDDWSSAVGHSEIPEILAFAKSLEQDRDAVVAGLTLEWSNGPTEGHVNRLKAIKRQMYGRAGFKMLRARVLARV